MEDIERSENELISDIAELRKLQDNRIQINERRKNYLDKEVRR